MDRIFNQFRRIYADNGSGDVDFTKQEAQLKAATDRLIVATTELVKSSDRLNRAALEVELDGSLN